MQAEEFKAIFLPYHTKMYRIAYRILRDQSNSEDALQETFIKLWQIKDELDDVGNKEAFAITVLRNKCFDILRKKKDFMQADFESVIISDESQVKAMESRDELRQVQRLIAMLPSQQRLLMTLRHWYGYSGEEMEQETGLSSVNIRVTLSRARNTIKEQLARLNRNDNK